MTTKYQFDLAVGQLGSLLLTVARENRSSKWENLYFAQPNTGEAQLRGFETKARAYLAELDCDSLIAAAVAREVGHVILLGTLAREGAALKKSAPKVKRQKSSIRRSDPRILGEAALVPADPALPAN